MAVSNVISRRGFLATCLVAPAAALIPLRRTCARSHSSLAPAGDHPTPRPGIDASRVPTAGELRDARRAIPVFDEVRQIPQIIDGIRCHCGCTKNPNHYSLLSCFETTDAMAKDCQGCRKQARYAFELHSAGKSLDQIRLAVDERFR